MIHTWVQRIYTYIYTYVYIYMHCTSHRRTSSRLRKWPCLATALSFRIAGLIFQANIVPVLFHTFQNMFGHHLVSTLCDCQSRGHLLPIEHCSISCLEKYRHLIQTVRWMLLFSAFKSGLLKPSSIKTYFRGVCLRHPEQLADNNQKPLVSVRSPEEWPNTSDITLSACRHSWNHLQHRIWHGTTIAQGGNCNSITR